MTYDPDEYYFSAFQSQLDLYGDNDSAAKERAELCDAIIEQTKLGYETERCKQAKSAYLKAIGYQA